MAEAPAGIVEGIAASVAEGKAAGTEEVGTGEVGSTAGPEEAYSAVVREEAAGP